METIYIKILACLACALFSASVYLAQPFFSAKEHLKDGNREKAATDTRPENTLVERFDKAIQQLFLSEPFFGMGRIHIYPPNPHLTYFSPASAEEREILAYFQKSGWKVGLYLFGKRTGPKEIDGKISKKFYINYRLNKPLSITRTLKITELPSSKSLLKNVKTAFSEFQTPGSSNENNYEFNTREWHFVARPVRAVNESCLKCHSDYVVTDNLGDGKYQFRKRRVGDANGVIVYGFTKIQK